MNYDIVIGAYKRVEMLKTLLNSIPSGIADIFIYFDGDDAETYNVFKDEYNCILLPQHEDSCLEAFNIHAKKSTKKGVIFLGDDMEMMPNAIENLIACFEKTYTDTDGLVGMNQFLIPTGSMCAAWLAGAKFMDRFPNREILYPGYHGRFSDTEMMQVGQVLNKFTWCQEAKIKHYQADSIGCSDFVLDEARKSVEKYQSEDAKLFISRDQNFKYMERVNKT